MTHSIPTNKMIDENNNISWRKVFDSYMMHDLFGGDHVSKVATYVQKYTHYKYFYFNGFVWHINPDGTYNSTNLKVCDCQE